MTDKEPTREQIKKLLEWCGFTEHFSKEMWHYESYKETNHWWEAPSGRKYKDLPELDPNNLFKYAVPVVIKKITKEQGCDEELAYEILFKKWLQKGYNVNALFWAIWEVIYKGGEKQ